MRFIASGFKVAVAVFGVAVGGFVLSAGHADSAETTIRVKADEARLVPLVSTPATIIIGNPSIADVSLQNGNLLVVMGRNFGSTNVIALNQGGEEIAHFELNVTMGGTHEVSLHRGSSRTTYNCAPVCEHELNVGDGGTEFDRILKQTVGKMGVADTAVKNGQTAE
ncbi:MAG: pilus assembly protein N-terminal domain-containing protein [Hyphomicrobiales bacterium]